MAYASDKLFEKCNEAGVLPTATSWVVRAAQAVENGNQHFCCNPRRAHVKVVDGVAVRAAVTVDVVKPDRREQGTARLVVRCVKRRGEWVIRAGLNVKGGAR